MYFQTIKTEIQSRCFPSHSMSSSSLKKQHTQHTRAKDEHNRRKQQFDLHQLVERAATCVI